MRVFVTGATGFIGTAVVRELIDAGHQVLGLARCDAAAKSLVAVGAMSTRRSEDLESLRSGAAAADGVIHTAFRHDWSRLRRTASLTSMPSRRSAPCCGLRPPVHREVRGRSRSGPAATEEDPALVFSIIPRVSEVTAVR